MMYCQLDPLNHCIWSQDPRGKSQKNIRHSFKAKICVFWAPGTIYNDFSELNWVCDPRWVSNALEQEERLKSYARAKKVVHNFAWNPLPMVFNCFLKTDIN